MANKKEIDSIIKELKTKIQENKVIIGTDRVLKRLQAGKLNKIYIASNCPQKTKDDLQHYAKLTEISITELEYDNEELGVFCKKNFFVSVLGIIEE